MTEITISLEQLRSMIGQKVIHAGQSCRVIEVIESQTALVLQLDIQCSVIQADQHGDAHRRVTQTVTVPVLTQDRSMLHPLFLELDLL